MLKRSIDAATTELVLRLDELAQITDEPGKLTRTFLSPAIRRANQKVATWMREAGMTVREDSVGNLIGRHECRDRRAPTLVLGSHLDTVRDAGRFDGAVGVLLPIAAVAELRRRGVVLPFALEVVGFSEEEGVRFSSAYLGSKGYAGRLQAADLKLRDAAGVSAKEALAAFNHGTFTPPRATHPSRDLVGYFEVHIEQGPVLEKEKLAVGVVTAIAGQTRGRLTFEGKAGHAGTTPMALRTDALAGAAEFVLAAETLARKTPGLVATVGMLEAFPGVPNVIPGRASLTLDVRHARDAMRLAAGRRLIQQADAIAKARGLRSTWQQTQDGAAVTCANEMKRVLETSVRAVQGRTLSLVSGAGHDAVILSAIAPVAMLLLRCRAGLSHHPDEYAAPRDLGVALRVTVDFLQRMAERSRRHEERT